MTQMFKDDGTVVPVTLVKIEPNIVVQVKTVETDGYKAIQIGTGTKKKLNKPAKGHRKALGNFSILKEFRLSEPRRVAVGEPTEASAFKVGDTIDISLFTEGETVKVSGISKGKGFQGVVKRHGFHGMPASHGAHSVLRHAGSIGQRFPQHTLKGMRMAGRMGGVAKSVRGLKIVKVDAANKLLAIIGAVPGNNGGIIEIHSM